MHLGPHCIMTKLEMSQIMKKILYCDRSIFRSYIIMGGEQVMIQSPLQKLGDIIIEDQFMALGPFLDLITKLLSH